jgi:hypothetical protein
VAAWREDCAPPTDLEKLATSLKTGKIAPELQSDSPLDTMKAIGVVIVAKDAADQAGLNEALAAAMRATGGPLRDTAMMMFRSTLEGSVRNGAESARQLAEHLGIAELLDPKAMEEFTAIKVDHAKRQLIALDIIAEHDVPLEVFIHAQKSYATQGLAAFEHLRDAAVKE